MDIMLEGGGGSGAATPAKRTGRGKTTRPRIGGGRKVPANSPRGRAEAAARKRAAARKAARKTVAKKVAKKAPAKKAARKRG